MAVFKATDGKVYYKSVSIGDYDPGDAPKAVVDAMPAQTWSIKVSGHWSDRDSYLMRRLLRRLAYLAVQRAARWN